MSTKTRWILGIAIVTALTLLTTPILVGGMLAALVGASATQNRGLCGAGDHAPGDWQAPQVDQAVNGLTTHQLAVAKQYWLTAHELFPPHLAAKAARAGIAMAKQESDLGADPTSSTPDNNHDVGTAQQRALPGWYGGKRTEAENIAVLNNPANAARIFYEGHPLTRAEVDWARAARIEAAGPAGYTIPGLKQIRGWEDLAVTVAIQRVQGSDFPDAYAKWDQLAERIITSFGTPPAGGAAAPAAAAALDPCTPPPMGSLDCPLSGLPIEAGLTPDAVLVVRCAHRQFPQVRDWAGIGDRPSDVDRDHQEGRAVDLMTHTDHALGEQIASWLKNNAPQLGIKYLIWNEAIWSAQRANEGWRKCGTIAASCYAGPDNTAAHRDHVHVSVHGNAAAPAAAGGPASSPLPRGRYTVGSRWGEVGSWSKYHTGLDLRAPIGTPVLAAAPGTVEGPAAGGWAGNHCIVRHPDRSATLYAHLTQCSVTAGTQVTAGQQIGTVGMTGRTFGPHLHFEHYPAGRGNTTNPYSTDDPYPWMASLGVRL